MEQQLNKRSQSVFFLFVENQHRFNKLVVDGRRVGNRNDSIKYDLVAFHFKMKKICWKRRHILISYKFIFYQKPTENLARRWLGNEQIVKQTKSDRLNVVGVSGFNFSFPCMDFIKMGSVWARGVSWRNKIWFSLKLRIVCILLSFISNKINKLPKHSDRLRIPSRHHIQFCLALFVFNQHVHCAMAMNTDGILSFGSNFLSQFDDPKNMNTTYRMLFYFLNLFA